MTARRARTLVVWGLFGARLVIPGAASAPIRPAGGASAGSAATLATEARAPVRSEAIVPGRLRHAPRFTPYFVGGGLSGIGEAEAAPGRAPTAPVGERPVERLAVGPGEAPRETLKRVEAELARDRSRFGLWVQKAELLAATQESRPARAAYEEALRLESRSTVARKGLARLLVESGLDPQRGATLLDGLGPEAAGEPEVLHVRALLALRKGDDAGASSFLAKVLEADPGHADARLQLGMVALRSGRNAEALRHFDDVVSLEPTNVRAHLSRGMVLARFRERDRALEAFARAWTLLGGSGSAARQVLARMRELDPYADPARMRLPPLPAPRVAPGKPASGSPPGSPVTPGRSAGPGPAGVPGRPLEPRPAGAVPGSGGAAPPDPVRAGLLDLRAPALPTGSPEPARPAREEERPDSPGRRLRMAELYRHHGLFEDAASLYHALVAEAPRSDLARQAVAALEEISVHARPAAPERIRLLRTVLGVLHSRRDRRGARDVLERLLLLDPRDPVAWRDLAYLAARDDDLDACHEFARKSLEAGPGNPEALLLQAYAESRRRRFPQALVIYRSLLEADPEPRIRRYAEVMVRALEGYADTR